MDGTVILSQSSQSSPDEIRYKIETCRDSLLTPSFFGMRSEIERIAEDEGDKKSILEAKNLLFMQYYLMVNTDSLVSVYDEIKNLALELGDFDCYYTTWSYLLNNFMMAGMTAHAINGANQMQQEALQSNNRIGIASSIAVMGKIYYTMGLYEKSIERLNVALDEFAKIGVGPLNMCPIYQYINFSNINLKRFNEVLGISDILDSLCISYPDLTSCWNGDNYLHNSRCLRVIALCRLGRIDKAKEYLDIIETNYYPYDNGSDYFYIGNSVYLLAEATYFETTGKLEDAIVMYDSVASYFGSHGQTRNMVKYGRIKASLLGKSGDYKGAFASLANYSNIQDSLNSEEDYLQLNEMVTINELRNIELSNKNLEIEVETANKRLYFIFIGFLAFLTIIISLFFLIQIRKNNFLGISELNLIKETKALLDSEKKLTIALQKANESDRLKSAFLANVSHEIRTPLNAIVGFSDLMGETEDKSTQHRYRDIIGYNSELLLNLINDILDLSKIEAGVFELKNYEFDLVSFFKTQYKTFSQQIKNPEVKLVLTIPDNEFSIFLDEKRCKQVLSNFVNNAIKFTTKGNITIGYEHFNEGIKLFVSDTGIGISEAARKRIFDRFYKVNVFTQGTGLGMAINKALVEAMKGEIGFDSTVGVGSTFWVKIHYDVLRKPEKIITYASVPLKTVLS